MKIHLYKAFFFTLVLLVSCNTSDKSPQSNEIVLNHSLPVVFINASESDLWSDSTGIYVEGLGSGENWQGLKANYFAGLKIPIDIQYYIKGERVLSQNALMKVSGVGVENSLRNHSIYLLKSYSVILFLNLSLLLILSLFVCLCLGKIGGVLCCVML